VPRRPKFIHPLRRLRETLGKNQPQFAKMFRISPSYVQLIELGKRPLTDELADEIMLRLGVDADSLKRRGKPQPLIGSTKAAYTISSIDAETFKTPTGLENVSGEYYAVQTITDWKERLRRSIALWRKMTPHWNLYFVRRALERKLALLFEALSPDRAHPANHERFLSVAMRLSRLIEDVVHDYGLRNAESPSFMETLADFRLIKPPRRRRRKR
jgi:transcriptional regulator with XRE-family HTH domain